MTNKQREDAIDALSDIRRVITWLEAGESSLEEVARVWWDNIHYISPVLALALPKRRPAHEDESEEPPAQSLQNMPNGLYTKGKGRTDAA